MGPAVIVNKPSHLHSNWPTLRQHLSQRAKKLRRVASQASCSYQLWIARASANAGSGKRNLLPYLTPSALGSAFNGFPLVVQEQKQQGRSHASK
jgi:hypothetical protein